MLHPQIRLHTTPTIYPITYKHQKSCTFCKTSYDCSSSVYNHTYVCSCGPLIGCFGCGKNSQMSTLSALCRHEKECSQAQKCPFCTKKINKTLGHHLKVNTCHKKHSAQCPFCKEYTEGSLTTQEAYRHLRACAAIHKSSDFAKHRLIQKRRLPSSHTHKNQDLGTFPHFSGETWQLPLKKRR